MQPFAVTRIAHIQAPDSDQRWLVENLWAEQAVGFIGGTPKYGLCRARHNPDYPASRIMPRLPPSCRTDAQLVLDYAA